MKRKNKDKKASASQDFRKGMLQKMSTKANDSRKKIRSIQIGFPNSIPSNNSSESDYDDHHDEFDFYDCDNNSNNNVAHHRTGNSANGMRGGQNYDLSKSNKLTRCDRNDDNDNIGGKRMRSERGTGGDDHYDEIKRRREGRKGSEGGKGRERGRGRERKEKRIKGNSLNDGSGSIYPNAKQLKGQTESTHSKKRRAHMTREDEDNDGYQDGDENENENRGKRRGIFSSEALLDQRRGNIHVLI